MTQKYLKNEKIYCIGDSHVSLFTGLNTIAPYWPSNARSILPQFSVLHIGPVLAYNLIEKKSSTGFYHKISEILEKNIPPSSWVLISSGEIDCRAHLIKQALSNNSSLEEVARICVDRYFKGIEKLMQTGHKFIIYNAIPSTRKNKPNTAFPSYGNCKKRNEVTMLFNKFSQDNCTSRKIIFLHTYNFFIHKNGLTNRKFYRDRIHLSQRALLPTMIELEKTLTGFNFDLPSSLENTRPSTKEILRKMMMKLGF